MHSVCACVMLGPNWGGLGIVLTDCAAGHGPLESPLPLPGFTEHDGINIDIVVWLVTPSCCARCACYACRA